MGQLVFQAALGGQVNLVGPNTASTFNLNVPAASDTLVARATTDTLTNKTLTSPVISGGTIDNAVIGGTTTAAGSFTTLSASSTVSGTGFSTYLASPPAIGGTTAAAGTFTTLNTSGAITTTASVNTPNTFGFKNRLINGAMVIDQRNAGASVTNIAGAFTYVLDRWQYYAAQASKFTVQQNAGSVTPPAGFKNYLGVTSSSAYSITSTDLFSLQQVLEGFNVADLGWGSVGAQSVTLSFWVRSSLTGTFGGVLQNTNSGANRSYPFTFSISAANTWEQKTITVAGDTSGTWGSTNGEGLTLKFGLGVGSTYSGTAGAWAGSNFWSATGATSVVGTNGATFYITGVQLEKGSTATSFDYRPYGTELALCQRYYWKNTGASYTPFGAGTIANGTTAYGCMNKFPVTMRTGPSASYSGTKLQYGSSSWPVTSIVGNQSSSDMAYHDVTASTALMVAGGCALWIGNNSSSDYVQYSAEL